MIRFAAFALAMIASCARGSELPIPPSYFGMTLNDPLTTPWPPISFGSLRTWDTNISWSDIAVQRGRYDWRRFDAIVELAARRNVDLVFTFGRTPRWAARDPDARGAYGPGQCSPPTNISDWDNFVRAVVERAAGRVKYWEIWNEPQDPNFYCGDIPTMVTLEKEAYRIIKSAPGDLQVVTPSSTGGLGPSWMLRFLAAGGDTYSDIIGFHGYWNGRARSLAGVVTRFAAAARRAGQGEKPMWDTEAGWGQNPPGMDASAKAAFLAKYYLLHWSLGVRRFYWYAYDNELGWGTLWTRALGLLPAGVAYREVRNWMVGATMTRPCAPDANAGTVWMCGFDRPGGYHAIALWSEESDVSYRVDSEFRSYRDITGSHGPLRSREMTLTSSPILLENRPLPSDR